MIGMDLGQSASVNAELTGHLGELLGGRDAGNSTPLADAVACAMMEDIRPAGVSATVVRAL